jgi:hypothetical protein
MKSVIVLASYFSVLSLLSFLLPSQAKEPKFIGQIIARLLAMPMRVNASEV